MITEISSIIKSSNATGKQQKMLILIAKDRTLNNVVA